MVTFTGAKKGTNTKKGGILTLLSTLVRYIKNKIESAYKRTKRNCQSSIS